MEEDLKILEQFLMGNKCCKDCTEKCVDCYIEYEEVQAVARLIKGYRELEYKYNKALSDLVQVEYNNKELEEKNKKVIKFCKDKSTFQTFGNEEMKHILETYINRLKHRIIDILEDK